MSPCRNAQKKLFFCPLARFAVLAHGTKRCVSLARGPTFSSVTALKVHIDKQHEGFSYTINPIGAPRKTDEEKKSRKKARRKQLATERHGTDLDHNLAERQKTIIRAAAALASSKHPGDIYFDLAADLGQILVTLRNIIPTAAADLDLAPSTLYLISWSYILTDPLGCLPVPFPTCSEFHRDPLAHAASRAPSPGIAFYDLSPNSLAARRPPWSESAKLIAWLAEELDSGKTRMARRNINTKLLAIAHALELPFADFASSRRLPSRDLRRAVDALGVALRTFWQYAYKTTFTTCRLRDGTRTEDDPESSRVQEIYLATMLDIFQSCVLRLPALDREEEAIVISSSLDSVLTHQPRQSVLRDLRKPIAHIQRELTYIWEFVIDLVENHAMPSSEDDEDLNLPQSPAPATATPAWSEQPADSANRPHDASEHHGIDEDHQGQHTDTPPMIRQDKPLDVHLNRSGSLPAASEDEDPGETGDTSNSHPLQEPVVTAGQGTRKRTASAPAFTPPRTRSQSRRLLP